MKVQGLSGRADSPPHAISSVWTPRSTTLAAPPCSGDRETVKKSLEPASDWHFRSLGGIPLVLFSTVTRSRQPSLSNRPLRLRCEWLTANRPRWRHAEPVAVSVYHTSFSVSPWGQFLGPMQCQAPRSKWLWQCQYSFASNGPAFVWPRAPLFTTVC